MSKSKNHNSDVSSRMMEILRHGAIEQLSQRGLLDYLEIELFEFYTKQTNAWLNRELELEQEEIKKQIAAGDPSPNDSGMMPIDYHIKRIQYSNVIYLASLLETCLQRACDNLKMALGGVPFELSDLRGDQWTKRYKFLERYGQFEFSQQLLKELETLTKIRNYLVHENGSTFNLKPEDKKIFMKCKAVDVDTCEFKIESPYVQHGLELLKQLVRELDNQMRFAIRRLKESQAQS